MGKVLLVIVVILLLVGGYYLVKGNPTNTESLYSNTNPVSSSTNQTGTATTTKETEYTVTYTNSGFSPKTMTIKKGETVTFKNESSGEMWVASNPHPTHTDYPKFDEKASVGNGGNWSFTFDQSGSWGYHNHRNASNTATIVVQ